MKKPLIICVALVALFLIVMAIPLSALESNQKPKVYFWLTILHNNDAMSELANRSSSFENFGGAAPFKTVVDSLKWKAIYGSPQPGHYGAKRGVIILSSGNNFLAGPEFNASLGKGVPFYDTIAMDLIGYDAVAIGNHDFDFGPDVLADFIEGYQLTQPKYLSSNLDFSAEPRLQTLVNMGRLAGSFVFEQRGELIGIIGALNPNLPFISSIRNVEVNPEVVGAVQLEVEKLEANGVDKIILISNMQDIDGDIALAAQITGIDAVIAGGSDELLANSGDLLIPGDEGDVFGPYPIIAVNGGGHDIPVVTTSGSYRYVGCLKLGFDKSGNVLAIGNNSGPVRVVSGDCGGTSPCDDAVEPNPLIQAQVVDPVTEYVDNLDANIIATSEVDLDGLRINVRSMETNEGNLIADSLLWQGIQLAPNFGVSAPDVALQNGGGIRNDSIILANSISELDTFNMVPFPNFLTILENISRAHFKEILENAVSRTQPTDTPGGTGRFAQIAGFSFSWSRSGIAQELDLEGNVVTPGTRVQEVNLNDGTVIVSSGNVVLGDHLTVVTLDFLARGGDQYPFRDATFKILGTTYQQALLNYLVMESGLNGYISASDYPMGGEGRIAELP